jgi:hypothetical protein
LLDLPNVPKLLTWTSASGNSTVPTVHGITVRGVEDKCAGTGSFVVQVTSPRGGAAAAEILIEGQARGTGRGSIDVRYLESGLNVVASSVGNMIADITDISFANAAGGSVPASYTINWGDGNSEGPIIPGAPPVTIKSHLYATTGTKTITVTAVVGGSTFTRRISVNVF